jgi:hypothetical protein
MMSTNGSAGGGVIRLTVGGVLEVDGQMSARGGDATQEEAGGGSGGSIWLTAGSFAGSGVVSADGGAGELYYGGGGGGGRIAVYSPNDTFNGVVSAQGGEGYSAGQTGSVYSASALPGLQVLSQTPTGTVSAGVSSVTLAFNSALNDSVFDTLSVGLDTPNGPLGSNSLTITSASSSGLTVNFPLQTTAGHYSLILGAGLESLFGQILTQSYTGTFTIALPGIQGRITFTNGLPVAGVRVQADVGYYTLTDTNGYYQLRVPVGSSFTVTPSFPGAVFRPVSMTYANVTQSVPGQDYLVTSLSGPDFGVAPHPAGVAINWQGNANISYQLQCSTNLVDWVDYGTPMAGTNGAMRVVAPVPSEAPRMFFRLTRQN